MPNWITDNILYLLTLKSKTMNHPSAPKFVRLVNAPWRFSTNTDPVGIMRQWDWSTTMMPAVVPLPVVRTSEHIVKFAPTIKTRWYSLSFAEIGTFITYIVSDALGEDEETVTNFKPSTTSQLLMITSPKAIVGDIQQTTPRARRCIAGARLEATAIKALAAYSAIATRQPSHIFHLPALDITASWKFEDGDPAEDIHMGIRPDRWNVGMLKNPYGV